MASKELAQTLTHARVLLVDDNGATRRAFGRALHRAGHIVIEVSNGQEAMAAIEAGDFDVVVSDVRMPDMGGVELLEAAREHDPDLPVVLMSGEPDLDTAMKAVKYGAFEYLRKPVPLTSLEASVLGALGLRRSRVQTKKVLEAKTGDRPVDTTAQVRVAESWTGALLGGRYRVGTLIGKGGMGAVYEADREDLGHMKVAVKVMLALADQATEQVARFRREAEAIAAIDHPNIVRVFDFQAPAGEPPFLVMELLHGAPLGHVIVNEGRFSLERTAFVASQVLDALAAAHRANIVHRDLKPDNVFITSMAGLSDIVKLLDFGIAKMLGDGLDPKLTQTGTVVGTPGYMSPEQARGAEADPRSDLYAVGCLMYEALSGFAPFSGDNYNALVFAVQQGVVPPLLVRCPDVDPAFAAVVSKAMARDAERRFQTADEMAESISHWVVRQSVPRESAAKASPMAFAPTENPTSGDKRG